MIRLLRSGLPSMVALSKGASVCVTDGAEELLVRLEATVRGNATAAERQRAAVQRLVWGEGGAAVPRAHLVLAAECIYDAETVPLLLDTIGRAIGAEGRALVAYDTKLHRAAAYAAFDLQARARFRVRPWRRPPPEHDSASVVMVELTPLGE